MSTLTHEQMLHRSAKYAQATPILQQMAREVANHLASKYGMLFTETENGYWEYERNFVLLSLRPTKTRLVVDLYRRPSHYAGLGLEPFFEPPRKGYSRIGIEKLEHVPLVVAAIDRAKHLRDARDQRRDKKAQERADHNATAPVAPSEHRGPLSELKALDEEYEARRQQIVNAGREKIEGRITAMQRELAEINKMAAQLGLGEYSIVQKPNGQDDA